MPTGYQKEINPLMIISTSKFSFFAFLSPIFFAIDSSRVSPIFTADGYISWVKISCLSRIRIAPLAPSLALENIHEN